MDSYDPQAIERKWQQVWEDEGTWQVSNEPILVQGLIYLPTREYRMFDGQVMTQIGVYQGVPVYADTPDQIVGIIDVKTFLLDPAEHYTETLLPPSFVPETMRAMDLLRRFLTHAQGLAIVIDEFGGTEGIITLADIVEEIMSDAAPLGDAELYIEPLEGGRFLVSGNARLDDLSEHLGFDLEADGIDTIGGFVFNRLGYLPPSGAQLEIPRLAITVRRAGHQRIEELLLEKTTGAGEADEGPDKDRVAA